EAIAWLKGYLAEADVLVQNLRPGVIEELGLGAETLHKINPRLIFCSLWAFGHAGPRRLRPGYEPMVQAFAGLFSVNGGEEDPPSRFGAPVLDMGTGMWAAMGVIAALHRRARTGRGGVVDASLFETALGWLTGHIAGFKFTGDLPSRERTGSRRLVPFQGFQTKNGTVIIAAGNDRLFAKLVAALGHPEWATAARRPSASTPRTSSTCLPPRAETSIDPRGPRDEDLRHTQRRLHRGARRQLHRGARTLRQPGRSLGVRQDHAARDDRRPRAAQRGARPARQPARRGRRASGHRISLPARCPPAVEDGAAERGPAPHDPRPARRRGAVQGRRVDAARGPGGVRELLPAPALGRHAQARLPGHHPDLRAGRAPDGRALQRPGRPDAQHDGE